MYTFNSDTDTLPEFNSEFEYVCVNIDNDDGTTTRGIAPIVENELPTSISFSNKAGLVGLSYLDTSNVNNMSGMFKNCNNLTSLDLSKFNTDNVTDMYDMFCNCNNLTSLDLSNFNTGKVNRMNYMFQGCNNLTSLDLSNFDTSNVTTMNRMFISCTNLTKLDLSNWNMNSVTDVDNMFIDSNKLSKIKMYNSDYNSVNKIIEQLPTRTEDNKGTLDVRGVDNISQINVTTAESKHWNVYDKVNCKPKFIGANKKLGKIKHGKGNVCIITTYRRKI